MKTTEQIRRFNTYLKTLRRTEQLLRDTKTAGCVTLQQINEAALKSNREAQQLVQQRIAMASRELVTG